MPIRTTPTRRTATPTGPIQTPTAPTVRSALERCVEPVASDEFLARYWEQKPLVVHREEPDRFHDLLSPADVERLICSSSLRLPAFRLVRNDVAIDARSYTTDLSWGPEPFSGTIDVDRALRHFEEGATIVLEALHHSWGPLAGFCRELETTLGEPVQANAYFTPRSAQGLPLHHDTHDVIVLQVAGKKHWRVFEPVIDLPRKDQKYSRVKHGDPGEPVEDCVLEAGDTMYLPRGWIHDALTTDSESLHLTIGVKVYTWMDAVKAALETCGDDIGFRRSVPADGEMQADLLEVLSERLSPDSVMRRKRERFLGGRRPIREQQLSQLRTLDELTVETPVARRETTLAELDFPHLSFEGKTIDFPAHVEEDIEFVASADGEFTATDLPGDLDEEGRLVLIRRLIREGFLRSV